MKIKKRRKNDERRYQVLHKIGEVVNMNTAASGASTRKEIKKETDRLGVNLSEREFHCAASRIFINKGLPSDGDFERAKEFARSMI